MQIKLNINVCSGLWEQKIILNEIGTEMGIPPQNGKVFENWIPEIVFPFAFEEI